MLPFLGFIAALFHFWGNGIGWLDIALFVAFYLITGFGVTVGYHRLFTHRSFKAVPWLETLLGVAGCAAVQGPILSWVADHRRHHQHSDHEGDPHSPHLFDDHGLLGTLGGLWHSHIGWLFEAGSTDAQRYAPDLLKDKRLSRIDSLYGLWLLLSLLAPAVLAYAITGGSTEAAISAVLFAGLARVFLLHHVTWSVNSICHSFGKRAYRTTDESRNNAIVGVIGLGEGWHNNHHAFPTSARHGLGKGQFDLSWELIRLFVRLGWVTKVQLPTEQLLQRKAMEPAAAE
ncbi:MAG TPA: acyl-CoA desaturase [Trueperaceae bacterium]